MYTRNKDIKLAIVFSKLDQSTIVRATDDVDIQAYSPSTLIQNESLASANGGFNNSTKISDASGPKFFSSREEQSDDSDEEDSEEFDKMFSGLKSKWAEPFLIKPKEKTKIQNSDNFSITESNNSQGSYSPNKVKIEDYEDDEQLAKMLNDDNPINDFKHRRHSRGCCFKFKISIVAFFKLAFLRNSLPPKYPILNLSMMIILLFLDIASAIMVFLLYEQKEGFAATLVPFAFIYPLTVVISPLAACASIFVCKSSFYRIFMNLNALTCCTNIFLTLMVELVMVLFVDTSSQLRSSQTIEPILLLLGKIALKITMSYLACRQLAFNDNQDFWRNRDILDEIYKNASKEGTKDYVTDM